jgi:hypothetical protein
MARTFGGGGGGWRGGGWHFMKYSCVSCCICLYLQFEYERLSEASRDSKQKRQISRRDRAGEDKGDGTGCPRCFHFGDCV